MKNGITASFAILCAFLLLSCAPRIVRQDQAVKPAPAEETDAAAVIAESVLSNTDKISNATVAVADFTDIDGKEMEEGKILSERIVTRMAMRKTVKVIEREKLRQVLDEQKLGLAGVTEGGDESVGKLLNADVILAGTILDQDGGMEITARLVSVRTGEIYAASIVKITQKDKIREYTKLTADQRAKIEGEYKAKDDLKKQNPGLYEANVKVKSEMILMRDKEPQKFRKVLGAISVAERLRVNNPGIFVLLTEPDDSAVLNNLKKNKPALFGKINQARKGLVFIITNVPSYKEKTVLDREDAVERLKKK